MDAHDKKPAPVTAAGTSTIATSEPVKHKKRGSTESSRRARDVEKRVSKAFSRVSKAADDAMKRYNKRRDKSDTKRKDGALMDMPENMIRAAAKAASKATPAVGDIMKLATTKTNRKMLSRNLGSVPTMPFMG